MREGLTMPGRKRNRLRLTDPGPDGPEAGGDVAPEPTTEPAASPEAPSGAPPGAPLEAELVPEAQPPVKAAEAELLFNDEAKVPFSRRRVRRMVPSPLKEVMVRVLKALGKRSRKRDRFGVFSQADAPVVEAPPPPSADVFTPEGPEPLAAKAPEPPAPAAGPLARLDAGGDWRVFHEPAGAAPVGGCDAVAGDMDRAVAHLTENTRPADERPADERPAASPVRQAVEAGELTLAPEAAREVGSSLLAAGFKVLDAADPKDRQTGDVVVIDGFDNRPEGHVAVYDGSNWVSDFAHSGLDLGDEMINGKPAACKFYRYQGG